MIGAGLEGPVAREGGDAPDGGSTGASEDDDTTLPSLDFDDDVRRFGVARRAPIKRSGNSTDLVSGALDVLRGSVKTILVIDNADALIDDDLFFYKLLDVVHFRERASLLVFTTSDYFLTSKLSLRVQSRFVHTLVDVGWTSPWDASSPDISARGYPPELISALASEQLPDACKFAMQLIVDRLLLRDCEFSDSSEESMAAFVHQGDTKFPVVTNGFNTVMTCQLAHSPLLSLMTGEQNPSVRSFVTKWNECLVSLVHNSQFLAALQSFVVVENTPGAILRVLGDVIEELLFGSAGLGCDVQPVGDDTSGSGSSEAQTIPDCKLTSIVGQIFVKHFVAARSPVSQTLRVQIISSLSTEALCLLCILVSAADASSKSYTGSSSVDAVVDEYVKGHPQLKLSLAQRQMIKRSDFELFASGLIYRHRGRLYVKVAKPELVEYKTAAGGMPGLSELLL